MSTLTHSNYQYVLRTSVEKKGATNSLHLEERGFLSYTGGGEWEIRRKRRRRSKLRHYENWEGKTRKTNKKEILTERGGKIKYSGHKVENPVGEGGKNSREVG